MNEVLDTAFDVALCGRALMDHNHGCHVADGLACPDCWTAAKAIVTTLQAAGRLSAGPGSFLTSHPRYVKLTYRHIHDDDNDAHLIKEACQASCHGLAGEAFEAAKVAVVALRSHGRLGELLAGEQAWQLFEVLKNTGAINFQRTPFKLSSGIESSFYIDMRIITDPEYLWHLGVLYADALVDEVGRDGFDVVFGPAYAAISLAVITSQALWQRHHIRKPHSSMRQEPKAHGRGGVLLGPSIERQRIAMVDDVMTTSGTKEAMHRRIAEHNGILVVTVVGVDRTIDPTIIPNFTAVTGAPVRPLATLQDIAGAYGFQDWTDCEAHRGQPHQ